MKTFLIVIGALWVLGSIGVPALESIDLGAPAGTTNVHAQTQLTQAD